jgi:CHASE2 domain-containing sensor protein
MDPVLCATLTAAKAANVPVFLAFPFERVGGELVRKSAAKALEGCVPGDAWGHPVGFVDLDHEARFIPLYFRHQKELPALSLRIATALAGREPEVPANGLLQLVAPRDALPQVTVETLQHDPSKRAVLRDMFVLIGEESERDRWDTPFGRKSGVWLHAAAVQALRHGHFVERAPWWAGLGLLFVACYLLITRAGRGDPPRRLALFCLIASLAIGALAAAACLALLWLDVIYPVVGLWLLLGLALVRRRWIRGTVR